MAKAVPNTRRLPRVSRPESEAIEGFGYDPIRRELEVRHKHGETYAYLDVPRRVFDELCAAPSRGKYVAEVVKQDDYQLRS